MGATTITYSTAHNNTHGTPSVKNGSGNITDDRYDALFCTVHANDGYNCNNAPYASPDEHAWSQQVVTSITSSGKDSSASSLSAGQDHLQLLPPGQDGHGLSCRSVQL